MRSSNSAIGVALAYFTHEFDTLRASDRVPAVSQSTRDLAWNMLGTAPKVVADLYESLIGAIFVDSVCDSYPPHPNTPSPGI